MTQNEIIRMAREATKNLSDADSVKLQGIVLLALDAGAAHEREACAKVCEEWGAFNDVAQKCAAAIRARGEK